MRIFFGVTIPEETKAKIIDIERGFHSSVPGARFEGKDKLHITLQFIGDFESERIEELCSSAAERLREIDARSSVVEIVGMNFFPNEKVKRGIWLDCKDDGTLAVIADSVRSVTRLFGIVPESRPFKPHITIARIKDYASRREGPFDLQKFAADGKLTQERFFPESVALYESTLSPDRSGSRYEILYEYSLQQKEF